VPYRVDLPNTDRSLDRLVDLGALDAEVSDTGIAALMPDGVRPEDVARAVGLERVAVSPVVGRDADSVWLLSPRPVQIGRLRIVPAQISAGEGALRLVDAPAFGTGLHPTTALCLEELEATVPDAPPGDLLDVGVGSGVLALSALTMGVPTAMGIDTDGEALAVAAENAHINALDRRLRLRHGGPETVQGSWPLVLANVLAAPLIEMAPVLVQRVAHCGRLVLSGIPASVEHEVARAYGHLGMRHVRTTSRGGWVALVMHATW